MGWGCNNKFKVKDLIEILKLTNYSMEDEKSLGLNGFYSYGKFIVLKNESLNEVTISLKFEKFTKPIKKEWPQLKDDIKRYQTIIKEGLSFGAYENYTLVGVIILENRKWNNTLWIDNLQILESINHFAINFYKKHGFEIDGLDISLYSNNLRLDSEFALYMKKKL